MKFIDKAELYRKIDLLRSEQGITGALDPFALAAALGIKVSVYQFESRRLSGMLLRGENHSEIVLSAGRCPESRRFAAAHELVHYFFHRSDSFFCCEDGFATALEWQANEGAAELLIPYREFLPAVKNIRSLLVSDSDRAVRLLAERFSASPAMIRTRLLSLSPEIAQYENGAELAALRILSRTSCSAAPTIDISAPEEN